MSFDPSVMSPVTKRVRAYLAPVNRAERAAAVFDPSQQGAFDLDAPPTPWLDLGWIRDFKRTCGTKIDPLPTGAPAFAQTQVRSSIDATVQFGFESWGKLQVALAAGTQSLNLLKAATGASAARSGATAAPALSLVSGSTASVLQMSPGDAATFNAGAFVAVDVDYAGGTGFAGAGVSGAYIKQPLSDVDYVRRITLNVGRVASVNGGAVTLEAPLLAGAPAGTMKVSPVLGFCDREGSSFFQEWSAVFAVEGAQGERVIWHYPRLQTMHGIAEESSPIAGGYAALRQSAMFRALPITDSVDGESVVCFRSYIAA